MAEGAGTIGETCAADGGDGGDGGGARGLRRRWFCNFLGLATAGLGFLYELWVGDRLGLGLAHELEHSDIFRGLDVQTTESLHSAVWVSDRHPFRGMDHSAVWA